MSVRLSFRLSVRLSGLHLHFTQGVLYPPYDIISFFPVNSMILSINPSMYLHMMYSKNVYRKVANRLLYLRCNCQSYLYLYYTSFRMTNEKYYK